jgi:hypothetical protein
MIECNLENACNIDITHSKLTKIDGNEINSDKDVSVAKLQWLCHPLLHGSKNLQVNRTMPINRRKQWMTPFKREKNRKLWFIFGMWNWRFQRTITTCNLNSFSLFGINPQFYNSSVYPQNSD